MMTPCHVFITSRTRIKTKFWSSRTKLTYLQLSLLHKKLKEKQKSTHPDSFITTGFRRLTCHLKYIDQHECFRLIDHYFITVTLKAIDLRGDSDTNSGSCVRNSTSLTEDWFPMRTGLLEVCVQMHVSAEWSLFMCTYPTGGYWLTERESEGINCVFFHFLSGPLGLSSR